MATSREHQSYGSVDNIEKKEHNEPLISVDPAEHHGTKKGSGFGEKNIGFFGGFCLLTNSVTGPGMVGISIVFQEAGYVVTLSAILLVFFLSTLSSTMLCYAMAAIPGNHRFEDRVELCTIGKYYLGKFGFVVTSAFFVLSLQSVIIASVVVSAQTMDLALIALFRHSCALRFFPDPGFVCLSISSGSGEPFGDSFVISLGFLIVLLLAIPLGYYNLDDNIIVQIAAWLIFMVLIVEWIFWFIFVGLKAENVPPFGDNYGTVVGTIIFNYAFVTTVPSWVNEKKPHVSVNKSLWGASFLGTMIFIFIGWVGASAYTFSSPAEDILDAINAGVFPSDFGKAFHSVTQITVYLFPLVTIVSGIPIFSIIIRYNLVENGICRKGWGNFWAVVFPWLVAVPFYTGKGIMDVINWTSISVNGVINFIIPLIIYISARRAQREERMKLLDEEKRCAINESPALCANEHETSCGITHLLSESEDEGDASDPDHAGDPLLSPPKDSNHISNSRVSAHSDIPLKIWPEKCHPSATAILLIFIFSVGILSTICINIYRLIHGEPLV